MTEIERGSGNVFAARMREYGNVSIPQEVLIAVLPREEIGDSQQAGGVIEQSMNQIRG